MQFLRCVEKIHGLRGVCASMPHLPTIDTDIGSKNGMVMNVITVAEIKRDALQAACAFGVSDRALFVTADAGFAKVAGLDVWLISVG